MARFAREISSRPILTIHPFYYCLRVLAGWGELLGCMLGLIMTNCSYGQGGFVVGWGAYDEGASIVPSNATNIMAIATGSAHTLALADGSNLLSWGFPGETPSGDVRNLAEIAAGGVVSLGIYDDRRLWVWSQLPQVLDYPVEATNLLKVAAGNIHALALRSDGRVLAWGVDYWGATVVPDDVSNIVDIAAGGTFSVALRSDGEVIVWGLPGHFHMGLTNVVAINATYDSCLALSADGHVFVGNADSGLSNIVAVAGGSQHWLALNREGMLIGVGSDAQGQSTVPPGVTNVAAIAAAADHSIALVNVPGLQLRRSPRAQTVLAGENVLLSCEARGIMPMGYTWSHNGNHIGQTLTPYFWLRNLQNADQGAYQIIVTNAAGAITSAPAQITVIESAPRIELRTTNEVGLPGASITVGAKVLGSEPIRLGWSKDGVSMPEATNAALSLLSLTWSDSGHYNLRATNAIGVSTSASAAITAVQAAVWGSSMLFQSNVPPAATGLVAITGGGLHALALREDGTLMGWGNDSFGQIDIPPSATNVVAITAGDMFSAALPGSGVPLVWGKNNYGQTNVPAAATNVIAVSAGYNHMLALRQDGKVLGWGNTLNGRTTLPATTSPIVGISGGGNHSLALQSDGKVLASGENGYSQASVPPAASNIIMVAAGVNHSLALRSDHSVLAWGDNSVGQCSVPADASNVVAIAAGGNSSMALRTDGEVISWGDPSWDRGTTPSLVTNVIALGAGSGMNAALVDRGVILPYNAQLPRTVVAGDDLVLLPALFGRPPMGYQWLLNGVALESATNAWLVLSSIQQRNAGVYSLVFGSGSTAMTNHVVAVTVLPRAPEITQQPTNQLATLGGSITFSAVAKGTEPISYQWRLNGINLAGATVSSLTIDSAQWTNAGSYDLVLSNAVGTALSKSVTLTFMPTVDGFDLKANNYVYALAPGIDGAVTVGGTFTTMSGLVRSNLARLKPDGTIDGSFNPTVGGYLSSVQALAIQRDRKLLVGGKFTSMASQPSTNLARLNSDGSLDSTFNPMLLGTVVNCVVLQPDGKIIVAGNFSKVQGQTRMNLARLNSDGSLDPGFTPNAGSTVASVVVLGDGKILVGGYFSTLGLQSRNNLGRLNADGSLDTNFNVGASGPVYALALRPNGKILVGGDFTMLGSELRSRIGQLNADGTVDAEFNPGADNTVNCLALQADGKILLGGSFTSLAGTSRQYVGRLNADGLLDAEFNPGASSTVYGLGVQADGRILAGGGFSTFGGQFRSRIARVGNTVPPIHRVLFENASVIWERGGAGPEISGATFEISTNGANWLALGSGSYSAQAWSLSGMILPSNATIRARGWSVGGYQNGSTWFVEDSAGPPAISDQPMSQTNIYGTNIILSVVAAGTPPYGYQWRRYGENVNNGSHVDGAQAPNLNLFGISGADRGDYSVVVSNSSGSVTSAIAELVVQDPFITVQPVSQSTNALKSVVFRATAIGTTPFSYQWHKEGVPLTGATGSSLTLTNLQWSDTGIYQVVVSNVFGSVTSAEALLGFPPVADSLNPGVSGGRGSSTYVCGLAVQGDQKIMISGNFTNLANQTRNYLGRLNADGTLDGTFNVGGDDWTFGLAIQEDGKTLVSGWSTMLGGKVLPYLARLNTDGSLDLGFSPKVSGGVANTGVYGLALQPDGKIIVGGDFNQLGGGSCRSIGRLNPDGTIDATFKARTSGIVYSLALQPDGRIVVGGQFTDVGGQPRSCIARLNPDGTTDLGFNPGADDIPLSLVVQPDGKIVAGGPFTIIGGQARRCIARLNPDGTLDPTFKGTAGSIVRSLALQTDGRILLGGEFSTLGTLSRVALGRLNSDGTTDPAFNAGANAGIVYGVTLESDGRILVAGSLSTIGGKSRSCIARLTNTHPATQNLKLEGSTVTWLRGGACPEVYRATFSASTNGMDWRDLGSSVRVTGGWQVTNVALPPGATVRARGAVAGGRYSASLWFDDASIGPPAIVAPPLSHTNLAGTPVTLLVTAAGTPPLSYQWLHNGSAVVNGVGILGATNSSLTLSHAFGLDQGVYSVVVSNALGCVTSLVANLTVKDPYITSQPISSTNNVGQTTSLSVAAIGTEPLSYEWRKNGAALSTATTASLTLTNLRGGDAGAYYAVVGNIYGAATSAVVQLSINPPAILANAGSVRANSNLFEFNVSAVIGEPVVIESSTNLTLWIPVQTNVAPDGGVFIFADPGVDQSIRRFYRARY